MGQSDFGINPDIVANMAVELKRLTEAGAEVGVVVGGGNIFRGAELAAAGLDRVTGDHMGMLATVINALALRDSMLQQDMDASVMSGLAMPQVCDNYTQREARRRISAGKIVIFAAGTGSPYFTTDTGASLRAIEINADLMIKATKVDGIYDKDPVKHPAADRGEHNQGFMTAWQESPFVSEAPFSQVPIRTGRLPYRRAVANAVAEPMERE